MLYGPCPPYLLHTAVKTIRKSRPCVTWCKLNKQSIFSMFPSIKEVNLIIMMHNFHKVCCFDWSIDRLSGQCSYAVHNTTVDLYAIPASHETSHLFVYDTETFRFSRHAFERFLSIRLPKKERSTFKNIDKVYTSMFASRH